MKNKKTVNGRVSVAALMTLAIVSNGYAYKKVMNRRCYGLGSPTSYFQRI